MDERCGSAAVHAGVLTTLGHDLRRAVARAIRLGGAYIRIFAGMYPDEVAGMVLVDPTPDSQRSDGGAGLPGFESLPDTLDQARASRVPIGIPLVLIDAVSPPEVPFATETIRALRGNSRREIEAESLEYVRWLVTIPGGRLVVTNRSGHNVAQEQPELVVETIRHVVDEVMRRAQP